MFVQATFGRHLPARLRHILSGELTLFGGPAVCEAVAGRVRAEQMANVIRYTPPMMLANVLAAMLVAAALWPAANRALLLAWTLAIVGLCGTVFLRRRWRAPRSRPPAVSERAIRLAVRNALILGCLWASLPLLFFETATSGGQLVIACLSDRPPRSGPDGMLVQGWPLRHG